MFDSKTLSLVLGVMLLVACSNYSHAIANNNDSLKAGSKAPALDIEHWVSNGKGSFKQVKNFEEGKVYVVEFWATWCPPCVASMPHLSELQKKYADKGLQIISISDEDLDTVNEFLEKKVSGQKDKTYGQLTSAYCLTTDPDNSSHEAFMEAADQDGIPSAFIVGKTGNIELICHPMDLDEPIELIINDKWDREAYAKKKKEEEKKLQKEMMEIQERVGVAVEKMEAGDPEGAVEAFDKVIEDYKSHPVVDRLKGMRLQMMNQIAWAVVEKKMNGDDVDEKEIASAAKLARRAVDLDDTNGAILDTYAHLLHLGGDLDKAIDVQKKALENAGNSKAEIEPFLEELLKEKADKEKKDK